MRAPKRGDRDRPSEAEVVHWLKRGLVAHGLAGRAVRDVLVDSDGSYLRSPYRRHLEPTGAIRIGDWRPDLVCVVEANGAERLAGFEVKSTADHEKGIVQAARYRDGVHEAYLCLPAHGAESEVPPWVRQTATKTGVGLLRAGPDALVIDLEPQAPQPDPRVLLATRRFLLGEASVRAFGLNKPLHYAAVLLAVAFTEEPWEALQRDWGLGESAIRLAVRGAENLGLVSAGAVTVRGKAYADILRLMGFTLTGCRHLTRTRLVTAAPNFAAVLRSVLLEHPAVDLVVQVLAAQTRGPLGIQALAARAHQRDEGLAQAVFGVPPAKGEAWQIRAATRFQLKAALYDVGVLDSPLAAGASGPQRLGGYDPRVDRWELGLVTRPIDRTADVRGAV